MEREREKMGPAARAGLALSKLRVWGFAGAADAAKRKLAFSIARRRLDRCAARAAKRAPERGITVIGNLTGQVSLDKTLRDFIFSLRDAGIPCQTYDTCLRPRIPQGDAAGLVTPPEDFNPWRYSRIAMMYRCPLRDEIAPECGRGRIVFHDSERGIHLTTPFLRDSGDDIIAMSDFNYRYFKTAFPDQKVFKITYPFRFKRRDAAPSGAFREKYGIGKDCFTVLFNFDFGSYHRKNIPAALEAFALAFGGDRGAKLVFKTKGAAANRGFVRDMEKRIAAAGLGGNVIHIPDYLPRDEVDGLVSAANAYLSLHKSEGFGIGMAEAMAQGIPVVATDWSANTEFCTPATSWPVPYRMVPIKPHEYPVEMGEWAEADPEAAAAALREISRNPGAAAARAAAGAAFMREHFSISRFKADAEKFIDGDAS